MSKLRNKTSWRIICVACIALILFTFIAPIIVCIGAYLEVKNVPGEDVRGLGLFAGLVALFWLIIFPFELYLCYCCWYCFSPNNKSGSKTAVMLMLLVMILTAVCLWLISDAFFLFLNIPKQTFYVLFFSSVSAIVICQISASIASAIHRAKARKKQSDTNT